MRRLIFFLSVLLSACNTPTPQFYGSDPVDVTVAGSRYRVFLAKDRAQALRLNEDMQPNRDAEAKITHAIQVGTGCSVVGKLKGDVVLATARVNCGRGTRPWPLERVLEFDCEVFWDHDEHKHDYAYSRIYCDAF